MLTLISETITVTQIRELVNTYTDDPTMIKSLSTALITQLNKNTYQCLDDLKEHLTALAIEYGASTGQQLKTSQPIQLDSVAIPIEKSK